MQSKGERVLFWLTLSSTAIALVVAVWKGLPLEFSLAAFFAGLLLVGYVGKSWKWQSWDPDSGKDGAEHFVTVVRRFHLGVRTLLFITLLVILGAGLANRHAPEWLATHIENLLERETPPTHPGFHVIAVPVEWQSNADHLQGELTFLLMDKEKARVEAASQVFSELTEIFTSRIPIGTGALLLLTSFVILILVFADAVGQGTYKL